MGYYSYVPTTDPQTRKKHFSFFWGYRSHAIVDTNSGLAIVEATFPNNMTDEKIARKLFMPGPINIPNTIGNPITMEIKNNQKNISVITQPPL